MNYSRSTKRKQNLYFRRLVISWLICIVLGFVLGFMVGALCFDESSEETKNFTSEVQETEQITQETPSLSSEPEQTSSEPQKEYLGNYRVTAYCSCEKCCGEWANNRPDGIVKGAAGIELKAGISVASPLPFGTRVYIEGYGEYVVQDRTAAWVAEKYNDKIVDIYFDNHEAACDFGLQYLDVYKIIESEDGNND